MDFKTASDWATRACITLDDIAKALGVAPNSIRRARLKPGSGGSYRNPPAGWQAGLAKLARARAAKLEALAKQLEGEVP